MCNSVIYNGAQCSKHIICELFLEYFLHPASFIFMSCHATGKTSQATYPPYPIVDSAVLSQYSVVFTGCRII